MKKVLLIALVVLPLGIALALYLSEKPLPQAVGQVQAPQIVLYTGENFTGRELLVEGTVFDLPREEEGDGSFFDWNDNVRSLIVVSGTWRLYQNGRCNTQLDDTRLEAFDIRGKGHVQGWSALVSGTSTGSLEIPDLAAGGLGEDLSSVELISQANLPDWVFAFRKP
jgi:hypothetical protein